MEKTIYIHVGGNQAGAGAIQKFLADNRAVLKKNGYLYPGHYPAHHDMAKEFKTLALPALTKNKKCATWKYFEEIFRSDAKNIILSSEGFEHLGRSVEKLKEFTKDRFLVKIIFYAMRQDEQLELLYQQQVRQDGMFLDMPFSDFVNQGNLSSLDYYEVLMPWNQAFGKENVMVRSYEEEQLPEGIFHDFLKSVGLTPDDRYSVPKGRTDKRLNRDFVEIIRICNSHFRDDFGFHRFLVQSLDDINSKIEEEKKRMLSPQQRRDVIARYAESNKKVALEYCGRTDGSLFYAPLPDQNEPFEPYQGLTVEKVVPVFTQMMFNLNEKYQRRIRSLENRSLRKKIMFKLKKSLDFF
jgi:hypothetical protein